MILLAIDTASHLCAACVHDTDTGAERGRASRDIGKGHAEQLMAVIDEALSTAGATYADLGGIAVSIGPGSFTGIRVGVAAARGFALALGIPSAGVTTLDALALSAREKFSGRPVLAALDAKRDELYVAAYDSSEMRIDGPRIATLDEAMALADTETVLCGTAAAMIAEAAVRSFDIASVASTADIGAYARLAALLGFSGEKPRPLYLRGADAKPQAGFTLARKPG